MLDVPEQERSPRPTRCARLVRDLLPDRVLLLPVLDARSRLAEDVVLRQSGDRVTAGEQHLRLQVFVPQLDQHLAAARENLRRGAIVVYESTVYPGATEEVCVPILEEISGLRFNHDFFCGYSPERINPGDRQHRLADIVPPGSAEVHLRADSVPTGTHSQVMHPATVRRQIRPETLRIPYRPAAQLHIGAASPTGVRGSFRPSPSYTVPKSS